MITLTRTVEFKRGRAGRKLLRERDPAATSRPVGRIPRVSRLMALAIRFDRLIRDGVVADQSALAQLAHVTQPRITQIMNLNHLAPDIQEDLLHLPRVVTGRDPVHEKMMRPICAEPDWRRQRIVWGNITRQLASR